MIILQKLHTTAVRRCGVISDKFGVLVFCVLMQQQWTAPNFQFQARQTDNCDCSSSSSSCREVADLGPHRQCTADWQVGEAATSQSRLGGRSRFQFTYSLRFAYFIGIVWPSFDGRWIDFMLTLLLWFCLNAYQLENEKIYFSITDIELN